MTRRPTRARAFAPATIANLSCGFDVLGLAATRPGDTVIAEIREAQGVTIEAIHGDGGRLPLDPALNTAGVAAARLLEAVDAPHGIALTLHKGMPLKSGLGSSAASAVAAAVATNALLDAPRPREALLPFIVEGERVACGSAHADNAAPALLGGLCLVRGGAPFEVISLPVPEALSCVMIHPHVEVSTEAARALLGDAISLRAAVTQWGNLAGLVAGLYRGDYELIGRCLHDAVAEPARGALIPHFGEIKRAALDAGALGCGISGSGPTLFALTRGLEAAEVVAAAMSAAYTTRGIPHDAFTSPINLGGAHVEIL